jgi:UDP:flavonoid glycosyltransferase YjiC (YdhE family)
MIICCAGYGIVTRAACSRNPVLAVPFMGDQPLVAEAVVQARLGLSSLPTDLSVEGLRDSLDELSAWDKRPLDRLQMAAKTYQAARQSADLVGALIQ